MQRKLSAISNCSDVSNLSVILGMDPNDFKSTIQNILGKLTDKKQKEDRCTFFNRNASFYSCGFMKSSCNLSKVHFFVCAQ